jgi:hypothetical protein
MKSLFYLACVTSFLLLAATASCKKETEKDPSAFSIRYGGVFMNLTINVYNGTDSLTLIGNNGSIHLYITVPQTAAAGSTYAFPGEADLRYTGDDWETALIATSGSITLTQRDNNALAAIFEASVTGTGTTIPITNGHFRLNLK